MQLALVCLGRARREGSGRSPVVHSTDRAAPDARRVSDSLIGSITDEVFGTQVPRASIANYSRLALGSLSSAQQL
jgi:hypothetical protein